MPARKLDAHTLADAIAAAVAVSGNVNLARGAAARLDVLASLSDVYTWADTMGPAAWSKSRRRSPEGPIFAYAEAADGRTYAITVELIRETGADLAAAARRMHR